jgi:hypothetical protein
MQHQTEGRLADLSTLGSDGNVDKRELNLALKPLNLDVPDADLDALFDWIDSDGNGSCSQNEFASAMKTGVNQFTKKMLLRDALKKLLFLIIIGLPIFALILAAIFGGLLAGIEGWSFQDSFYITLAVLTSTDITVATVPAPETTVGRLIGCLVGLVSLAVVGGLIGITGGPLLDPIEELLGLNISDGAHERGRPLRESLWKMFVLIFGGIPAAAMIISAIFGLLLCEVEGGSAKGWTFHVGFYAVLKEISGTNLDVVSTPTPDTHGGKLMACLVGIWGLSLLSSVVGIMGGPLLDPIISVLGAEPEEHEVVYGSQMMIPMGHARMKKITPDSFAADPDPADPAAPTEDLALAPASQSGGAAVTTEAAP